MSLTPPMTIQKGHGLIQTPARKHNHSPNPDYLGDEDKFILHKGKSWGTVVFVCPFSGRAGTPTANEMETRVGTGVTP